MRKSPTECRAGGRTGRECLHGVLCDWRMNVKIKGKVYRTVVRATLVCGGRDMGIEEGTGKEIGSRRNENATMDVQSYKAGQYHK